MVEKSQQAREETDEHNAAFDKAHERGDTFSAAIHARDAIAADIKADEFYRVEHPELERLDRINSTLKNMLSVLTNCMYCLFAIFVMLCVIAYKHF